MNLLGQQQPSVIQQGGAGFLGVPPGEGMHHADDSFALGEVADSGQTAAALLPGNTLALLESRLNGLMRMIATLNAKNEELRLMMADRDDYIELVEQENALLNQQVERFSVAQGQVIDGLSGILSRFPGGELLDQAGDAFDCTDVSLLAETIGNA